MNTGSFWSSTGTFYREANFQGVNREGKDYFDPHLIIKESVLDPCHFRIELSDEGMGWGNANSQVKNLKEKMAYW